MLLLEVVEPVVFDAPHLSHPPDAFVVNARPGRSWFSGRWKAAYLGERDFDITAWVAAALPAAAASLRYVRNLWQ